MGSLTSPPLDLMEFICLLRRPPLGCTLGLLRLWSQCAWQQSLPPYWSSGNTASQSSKHDLLACLNEINILRTCGGGSETHHAIPACRHTSISARRRTDTRSWGGWKTRVQRRQPRRMLTGAAAPWKWSQTRSVRCDFLIVAFTVTSQRIFYKLSLCLPVTTESSGMNNRTGRSFRTGGLQIMIADH